MIKNYLLFFSLLGLPIFGFGQTVQGFLYDAETKQRVSGARILNATTKAVTTTDMLGEFHLAAKTGDMVITDAEGYFADTAKVEDKKDMVFKLKRSSILLKEVTVIGRKSTKKQWDKKDYEGIYKAGSSPLSTFNAARGGLNFGIGADYLYGLFSHKLRNAEFLDKIMKRDQDNTVIDARFSTTLVSQITGLKDKDLIDFMVQYRPSIDYVTGLSDYEMVSYIRDSYLQYQDNPAAYRLPPLPKYSMLRDSLVEP